MSSFGRAARVLAAAALLTTVGIGFASSAGAATTGSLAAVTNGVTVTYSSSNTATDEAVVTIFASPYTCPASTDFATLVNANPPYILGSQSGMPPYMALGSSPRTLQFGSTVAANMGQSSTTIAAGTWVVCLFADNGTTLTSLASLTFTAVDPSPPTTTTPTTSAPTTTAAGGSSANGGDPVVPAFTG